MIIMNNKMKKLSIYEDKLDRETKEKLDQIIKNTRLIKDCIVYDEENLNETSFNIDRVLKFTKTYTAYEIGCNELLIDRTDNLAFTSISDYLLNSFEKKFKDFRFVVYLIVQENTVIIRFHIYRENEGFWLSNDLNEYDDPILCNYSF